MKKILFLLLLATAGLQAQTLQSPTYNATTTNTLKVKTPATVSSVNFLSTNEADGSISKIAPINVNIPYIPVNYSAPTQTIGNHLAGIDTRLGQISSTSAGLTQRIYFTADNTTVNAVTYFSSNATSKGTTATGSPPALVLGDNTKGYFTKDIISIAQPSPTIGYAGTYSGNLTVSASPTPVATQQRFTLEVYRTNNLGVPISSGVSGAPVGDLGVTVVAILDSGVINLSAGAITNVSISGILTQNITINTGERLRYHVSAAKIGAGGGNVTFGVYYGTSYNSYYDVPVAITTDAVLNKSAVTGVTDTDALNSLNTLKEDLANKAIDYSIVNNTLYPSIQASKNQLDTKLNNSAFYQTPLKLYNQFIDQTKNANIVFLGDSNFDSPERMPLPFLKSLMYQKKSTGVGFFSFSAGTVAMGLNTATRTGTWIDTDIFAGGKGLDGRDAFSNTANSEITITTNSAYINSDLATYDNVRILYAKGSSGTVAYSINSGSYTNVVLTTGSGDLGAFDIPMGSLSSTWNLKIKLISGEVRLLGGLMTNNTDRGLIVNKTAHSGAASSHFSLLSNNQSWKSALSLTDPSIVFIGLTTNDFNNNIPSATTKANLTNLINNIKAAVPSASIYMIAPPKSDPAIVPVQPVTAAINAAMLKDLTKELNIGFISIFDSWSKLPETYTNTLYSDGIHYNDLGAATNSSDLKRYLGLKQDNSNLINSLTIPNVNAYIPLNIGGNTFSNSRLRSDNGLARTIVENNFGIEGNFYMESNNSGLSAIFIDRVSAPNSRRFKFSNDRTAQGLYEFQSERTANSGTYITDFALSGITGNVLFGTISDNGSSKVQVNGTVKASDAVLSTELVTLGQLNSVAPVGIKRYKALISQTGTSAPTVIVLENSIGSIVWSRTGTGQYTGTLAGAFTSNKVYDNFQYRTFSSPNIQTSAVQSSTINTIDIFSLSNGTVSDSILTGCILIEVYP